MYISKEMLDFLIDNLDEFNKPHTINRRDLAKYLKFIRGDYTPVDWLTSVSDALARYVIEGKPGWKKVHEYLFKYNHAPTTRSDFIALFPNLEEISKPLCVVCNTHVDEVYDVFGSDLYVCFACATKDER